MIFCSLKASKPPPTLSIYSIHQPTTPCFDSHPLLSHPPVLLRCCVSPVRWSGECLCVRLGQSIWSVSRIEAREKKKKTGRQAHRVSETTHVEVRGRGESRGEGGVGIVSSLSLHHPQLVTHTIPLTAHESISPADSRDAINRVLSLTLPVLASTLHPLPLCRARYVALFFQSKSFPPSRLVSSRVELWVPSSAVATRSTRDYKTMQSKEREGESKRHAILHTTLPYSLPVSSLTFSFFPSSSPSPP